MKLVPNDARDVVHFAAMVAVYLASLVVIVLKPEQAWPIVSMLVTFSVFLIIGKIVVEK